MTKTVTARHMEVLLRLVLGGPSQEFAILEDLLALQREDLDQILALANSHHVVMRALPVFRRLMTASGRSDWANWTELNIHRERMRIQNALSVLSAIDAAFRSEHCDLTVIKSLDHWPDLGNDLDLYTNADSADVICIMSERFQATLEARSWGDRLANKWNFTVPGLNELVEVHAQRLGQTGEHVDFARAIPVRSQTVCAGEHEFSVPCSEHRLLIATLQRMYRHFYLRLCDIADTAQLLETQPINYQFLCNSANTAGIWEGVATFLCVVSDYMERFRGTAVDLPGFVRSASRLRGNRVRFSNGFLRVPILPESVSLYATELSSMMKSGQVAGSLRLSLLPCLATVAALEQKLTGSDKGIW